MRYSYFPFFVFLLVISCTPYHHGVYVPTPSYTEFNSEEYAKTEENKFHKPSENPLSTFSIDVDGASYSNVKRIIQDGSLPPSDAVRIEELINYFDYNYTDPGSDSAFSINTSIARAPWNPAHYILQIGLKGSTPPKDELVDQNLVFLIDVSGSMNSPDKLDLVKKGMKLLVDQLKAEDNIAIVVYSGRSEVVLESTPGDEKKKIISVIDKLRASGSTAGSDGIQNAYRIAEEQYSPSMNNRVILATDGDFNVGITDQDELKDFITEKKESGVYLTVLGVGIGNLKDYRLELLANKGNGNYYYIDNLLEAKKVFVTDLTSTLYTIANDVKIQVEFNPYNVKAYRLIGYENRLLADEDFNDDTKDAGELGAGHTVTALYEVVLNTDQIQPKTFEVDPLRYQSTQAAKFDSTDNPFPNELATIKLRYKPPHETDSRLSQSRIMKEHIVGEPDTDLTFISSVASFGMMLRDSRFKGQADYPMILDLARKGKGEDKHGYRAEFIKIAELAELLYQGQTKN